MKVGKLIKIGDSLGIVIPRQIVRKMGWMVGDYISQEPTDSGILIGNVTQHSTRFIATRAEFGDGRNRRPEQPVRDPRNTA